MSCMDFTEYDILDYVVKDFNTCISCSRIYDDHNFKATILKPDQHDDHKQDAPLTMPSSSSSSISQRAISQTLSSTANLANLLPTGTLLAFQLLIPVFTSNGSCDAATRPMTLILLLLLALSCFLASFTDNLKSPNNGQVCYGIATPKGLYLFDSSLPVAQVLNGRDLSKYRMRFIDFVHAILSVLVFGAVALRDKNVVGCLYPTPGHETQEILDIVPIGVGLLSSLLFVIFPTTRHGIGYPLSH